MAFLIALALVLGACYAPDARDCVLACAADSDCVQGQVCTADHWCAAPPFANGCIEPVRDGGADAPPVRDGGADARLPKHDAHDDDVVDLHIHIDGPGTVTITGGSTCESADCTFPIAKGVPAVLTAAPKANHAFDRWTSTTCAGQPAVCTFTPTTDATAAAKFRTDDTHD